jgi:hypothetical protein
LGRSGVVHGFVRSRVGQEAIDMLSKLLGMFKSGSKKSGADTPSGSETYMSQAEFADAYAAYVRKHAPDINAERVDDGVQLAWPDGGTMRQFLNNAYTNYRRDVAATWVIFDDEIAAARQAAASLSAEQGLDLALLMPVVKTTDWLATVIQQRGELDREPGKASDNDPNKHSDRHAGKDSDKDLIVHPLLGDLIVTYAQDLPKSLEYVKRGDLGGLNEASLRAHALANLEGRSSAFTLVGGEGRYRIELDGFFDVSLILIASTWVQHLSLAGDPVFALPCRDQLMVCGSDDHQAVSELAEMAPRIAAESAYAITGQLLVLRGGILQAL